MVRGPGQISACFATAGIVFPFAASGCLDCRHLVNGAMASLNAEALCRPPPVCAPFAGELISKTSRGAPCTSDVC